MSSSDIKKWCGLLKKHRILAGLSQREVGEKMAELQRREKPYGRQYIHKIESGKESIGLDVMFRYCDAIGARAELELNLNMLNSENSLQKVCIVYINVLHLYRTINRTYQLDFKCKQ